MQGCARKCVATCIRGGGAFRSYASVSHYPPADSGVGHVACELSRLACCGEAAPTPLLYGTQDLLLGAAGPAICFSQR